MISKKTAEEIAKLASRAKFALSPPDSIFAIPSTILVFLLLLTAFIPNLVRTLQPYLEERLPDSFSVDKVALDVMGTFPSYEMPDLTKILRQPFHYIGHGAQAVAFASEDDRYVLKFFLRRSMHGKKRYPIPKPTHWLPSHRKKRHERRERIYRESLFKTMRNYVAAFEKLKERTGLIALHLNASDSDLPTVRLFDQAQKEHSIDLNRASFVLQKKALLVKQKLARLSGTEKAQALQSLEDFFEMRAREGFVDIERSFMIEANYGFLGDTPIQLDVGNIEYLEDLKESPQKEIARMRGLLHDWAAQNVY